MIAFADGLNFYLYKHPEVKPRVITRFEPWMALCFSEGSIGGDIEKFNVNQLQAFYGKCRRERETFGKFKVRNHLRSCRLMWEENEREPEPTGSTGGMAISPTNTTDHHALLLINPHTSFYFRSELQMVSDEGLNAYGAATWGRTATFFILSGDSTIWQLVDPGCTPPVALTP